MIMTLSMGQGIRLNTTSSINPYQSMLNNNTSGLDFNSLMNMMLTSSFGTFGSNDTTSNLQSMLFTLAPLFQNMNISNEVVSPPSGTPVNGVITQNYHSGHPALDFGIDVGTPVKSTMAGRVTYAGWNDEGYGNLVIVDNGTYQTYYGHLESIPVTVGQQVSSGEIIGLSGNTGNSTGPHLHYEIRADGHTIDPTTYTFGRVSEYFV
jgi:murein DD-endopeptidase MepM/ murein hydrolase activator NlpD